MSKHLDSIASTIHASATAKPNSAPLSQSGIGGENKMEKPNRRESW